MIPSVVLFVVTLLPGGVPLASPSLPPLPVAGASGAVLPGEVPARETPASEAPASSEAPGSEVPADLFTLMVTNRTADPIWLDSLGCVGVDGCRPGLAGPQRPIEAGASRALTFDPRRVPGQPLLLCGAEYSTTIQIWNTPPSGENPVWLATVRVEWIPANPTVARGVRGRAEVLGRQEEVPVSLTDAAFQTQFLMCPAGAVPGDMRTFDFLMKVEVVVG